MTKQPAGIALLPDQLVLSAIWTWRNEDTPNICLMSESDDEDSDSANVGDSGIFLKRRNVEDLMSRHLSY